MACYTRRMAIGKNKIRFMITVTREQLAALDALLAVERAKDNKISRSEFVAALLDRHLKRAAMACDNGEETKKATP
jgi:hypothetical protein